VDREKPVQAEILHTRPITNLLLLSVIAGLAIVPFIHWGNPSGHDFEFHMYSWMEVLQQWKLGVIYPHWAGQAHWGCGEARFLFYPPGSWVMGATLGAIVPWKVVPGVYCWMVLTLAGFSMYVLARRWLGPSNALFAAAFYALNPYHLLVIYWRSAFAELLAAVLLPLVPLCLLKLKGGSERAVMWLGLVFAGAWLANAPAAVMIHYSAAGLVVVLALQEKSAKAAIGILAKTGAAVVLGAGMAAVYLVPAIYEEPWVSIAALLSPGVRPQDNFLFTYIADADHNRFNLLVSLVAMSEIAVFAVAAWMASRRSHKNSDDGLIRSAWTWLASWGAVAALAMVPVCNFLWLYLPKFRYVQLPFRWLLCLNVPLALLLAGATACMKSNGARWMARTLVCAFLLATLLVSGRRVQPPWWDQAADIQEMDDAMVDGIGYDGTDEYVPAGDDPYELKKDLPQVSDENGAAVKVQVLSWSATDKHFSVRANSTKNLTIRLFNYPAWKVTVNSHEVATPSSEVTGLMIVPVGSGENDVQIIFGRTRDCTVGGVISLLSIVLFAGLVIKTSGARKPRDAGERSTKTGRTS